MITVQLLSAHAALALLIAAIVFLILLALGVPPLFAAIAGGLVGWLLTHTVLRDVADRAERWLTTPK